MALTILSGLPLPDLVVALATQNARRLATIPGIGKKLAERLGLELREKMAGVGFGDGRPASPRTSAVDEAVEGAQEPRLQAGAGGGGDGGGGAEDLNALLSAALTSLAPK